MNASKLKILSCYALAEVNQNKRKVKGSLKESKGHIDAANDHILKLRRPPR